MNKVRANLFSKESVQRSPHFCNDYKDSEVCASFDKKKGASFPTDEPVNNIFISNLKINVNVNININLSKGKSIDSVLAK